MASEVLIIDGPSHLTGTVRVSGAKNAALPVLCATLLTGGVYEIENCPRLTDVFTLLSLLKALGAGYTWDLAGTSPLDAPPVLRLDTNHIKDVEAPFDLVQRMRASFLVLGPLVARFGRARVPLPGGCEIGARPVDFHLSGLEALGATWSIDSGVVDCQAKQGLKGATIPLDFPSVTGTENLLMAATLAKGITVIENAAKEPEVVDLGRMLQCMGAKIHGLGQSTIRIEGVTTLRPVRWTIVPDRIEAGTLIMAVGVTGGNVRLQGVIKEHLEVVLAKLGHAGLSIAFEHGSKDTAVVESNGRPRSVDATTAPFPGFPTDLQAQLTALMAFSTGLSVITETIFENRFRHVDELRRLGADIRVDGRSAVIRGREGLKGAPMTATDLRASSSLVIAALGAHGKSIVHGLHHLDRGYEGLDHKLRHLGARIERVLSNNQC